MRDDTTFNAFVDWAKSKDEAEGYRYSDNFNCAYAQFLKQTGRAANPMVGGLSWRDLAEKDSSWTDIDDRLTGEDRFGIEAPLQAGTFGGILRTLKENGHVSHDD